MLFLARMEAWEGLKETEEWVERRMMKELEKMVAEEEGEEDGEEDEKKKENRDAEGKEGKET